jgi:hypothetical protein
LRPEKFTAEKRVAAAGIFKMTAGAKVRLVSPVFAHEARAMSCFRCGAQRKGRFFV